MLKEFKEFIARGNVLDIAVGIIIGVAFGKIITSLVNDIIMPVVGLLLGKLKAVRCPNCTSQIEEAANS